MQKNDPITDTLSRGGKGEHARQMTLKKNHLHVIGRDGGQVGGAPRCCAAATQELRKVRGGILGCYSRAFSDGPRNFEPWSFDEDDI
ncbi:hypothetical protein TNCV_3787301 [Trichonephila clavipes]|nr:hypothetical protein TNCV_3787301 [Trichonephila clavipes]